ncbi:MAG: cytochrome c biogenesis protein CcdA [Candidatus Azambacteria bacterium]|nr:cytochrome c biogenesis protein CcdA [Candidatus Azambacteria bacterium]
MELLLSASIVAAFIAGVAALFAPCCITVLLPSYFASIFREKRKVFVMTFIFFLGILAVFLPIGLGAAAIGKFFSQYHNVVFGVGGIFLVVLGAIILTGKHFSLPFQVRPAFKKHNAASVFMLGILSGIATTCCAPVLAGVLALAALPGSVLWGGIYTLGYVFGMVAPLFLISLFLDRINFKEKFQQIFHKPIQYRLGGKEISITISETVSGITFLVMGILILYLAFTNRLFMQAGGYQTDINIYLTKVLQSISGVAQAVPEYVWALLLVIIIGGVVWRVVQVDNY